MIWSLALLLAERLSMVATAAFVFSRSGAFGRVLSRELTLRDRVLMALALGLMGIVGTYAGVPVGGALANSRIVGVMVAGLLGGPLVGAGAGLVAGIHRYWIGGFTAFSCALAAVLEGLLGGLVQRRCGSKAVTWPVALAVGALGEVLQMSTILATARPFHDALALVRVIGLPMIVVNSAGMAIFMVVVQTGNEVRERIAATQAQQTLKIASQTLAFLRQGLNRQSAESAARIIHAALPVAAVAITDQQRILAHVGVGIDHHCAGSPIQTNTTRLALATGEVQVEQTRAGIACQAPNCRLGSTVVAPLKHGETVIGTLKLYHPRENSITPVDVELAQGLATLFSNQLALAELERQAQLRTQAELKALQAQIHPHFLFNALNAIVSLVRTQPEKARELLIKLADFFRSSLRTDDVIPLRDELSHVDAYLAIETARFGPKLEVVREIDPAVLDRPIPAFTLQPLVENAIRHGLHPRPRGGRVTIRAVSRPDETLVTVADDGVGIPPEELKRIFRPGYGKGNGLGLNIVWERAKHFCGPARPPVMESEPGQGTRVELRFPIAAKPNQEGGTDSVYGVSGR
jgi:two-component system sensor histidine kinase LytS